VAPGQRAFTQVRAWESARGTSYEEARALGGKFGRSDIVEVIAGAPANRRQLCWLWQSFSLQVGLPQFSVGVIQFKEQQPDGALPGNCKAEPVSARGRKISRCGSSRMAAVYSSDQHNGTWSSRIPPRHLAWLFIGRE